MVVVYHTSRIAHSETFRRVATDNKMSKMDLHYLLCADMFHLKKKRFISGQMLRSLRSGRRMGDEYISIKRLLGRGFLRQIVVGAKMKHSSLYEVTDAGRKVIKDYHKLYMKINAELLSMDFE